MDKNVAAVSLAKAGVCYLLMSVLGILVRDNLVGGKEGCKKTAEGWRLMCAVCMCVCVRVCQCLALFALVPLHGGNVSKTKVPHLTRLQKGLLV